MNLRDVMTTPVESVEPIAPLREAALKMKKADVGMLPVIEKGEVVGIVTDRDLAIRGLADDRPGKTIRDVMTPSPVCLHVDRSVEDAIVVMTDRQVGRVVVTDDHGHVVGVLSSADIAVACAGDARVGRLAMALSHSHKVPSKVLAV